MVARKSRCLLFPSSARTPRPSGGITRGGGRHLSSSGVRPFVKVPTRAILDPSLSHGALRVLTVLASYADDQTHRCYPSLATIGRALGLTKQTVAFHLDHLLLAGYVHRRSRAGQKYVFEVDYTVRPTLTVDTGKRQTDSDDPSDLADQTVKATLTKQELEQEPRTRRAASRSTNREPETIGAIFDHASARQQIALLKKAGVP